MNKIQIKNKINKVKQMPKRISLFLVFIIALEIYYFFSFMTKGLLVHYGYSLSSLTSLAYPIVLIFLLSVIISALIIIAYGFIHQSTWARKYAMMFIICASIWPLWGIIVGSISVEQLVIFILQICSILYLTAHYVKHYFGVIPKPKKLSLSKKDVTAKTG